MKECFWEKFTQTGRVEDYLSYKGMEICQDVIEKHKENGEVSEKDEQFIQEFKEAYCNSLKLARMLNASEVVKYSSMAIAIFNNEKPEKGIKILKLCTKFLKAHNEYEIACLERQKIRKQARQQQASQSNNTTPKLSGSYVDKLAQNRAKSNSNSNKNSL